MEEGILFEKDKHYSELSLADQLLVKLALKKYNISVYLHSNEGVLHVSNETVKELNDLMFPVSANISEKQYNNNQEIDLTKIKFKKEVKELFPHLFKDNTD